MQQFLKAKIHSAIVTEADLEYEGSMGMDLDVMEQVGILPFEAVEVYNITNGARIKTYAIALPRGSKQFQSNGAAAHLIRKNDRVIIASYAWLNDDELARFVGPKIAIMTSSNDIKRFYQANWRKPDTASL